jgi:hypothetical protein
MDNFFLPEQAGALLFCIKEEEKEKNVPRLREVTAKERNPYVNR